MRDLRILPEVLEDVKEAVSWYERCGGSELGDRFVEAFEASLSAVLIEGEIYRPIHGEFRRVLMKPFPYAVYFRIHQSRVVVTLVWHTARNPLDSKRRLVDRSSGAR